ncbi:hypothetical protein [Variovorax sp. HJSM1_2]|uniref:hypothetical protein n=1 Tax=Variovorax sp. HJSM1_2 TaxID=3366263 RepID=UPI003BEDFC9B
MSGSKLSDATYSRADASSTAAVDEPLGLTIHSLPTPQDAVAEDARRTYAGRWKMLAVMLVCAAPVIASYFTFYVIKPEGRPAYGDLVEPVQPMPSLPTLAAVGAGGEAKPLTALRGQWLLVTVGGAACDAVCERNLYLQRQLRESLGREKDRMDRVWLVTDNAPIPDALMPALKGASVLRVDAAALAAWLHPAQGQALSAHLYVVDPMGNWMMRFPAAMDNTGAASAKRSVERLLRASASWDEPGR